MSDDKGITQFQTVVCAIVKNVLNATRGFVVKASASMDLILDQLSKRGVNHPLVIVLGARNDIRQVFIAVEGHVIPVTRGLPAAVDELLKFHYIMNMEYAMQTKHVLLFLQRCIMGIPDNEELCRSAADLALFMRQKKVAK